jgi:predicted metal-dependent peptidase
VLDPPTALVFLTDGFGPALAEAPPYPVLWTLTPDGERPCAFGAVLRLDAG